MIGEKLRLKIVASDGFTTASETVVINLDIIPVSYYIYIVLVTLCPLLFVFALIKYRAKIYEIFCRKYYQQGVIYVQRGSEFKMKIWLGKHELKEGEKHLSLIRKYLKEAKKKNQQKISPKKLNNNNDNGVSNIDNTI